MEVKLVDTTLRDGEQAPGLALDFKEKLCIAEMLDSLGVDQIEAGIPAMCPEERKCVEMLAGLGLNSRISAWNRMNTEDIRLSMECGVEIIHISVPASDIQIFGKLKKDRRWVLERMLECIEFAAGRGFEVTVGLEDASRADFDYMASLLEAAYAAGVKRVRYADTVGVMHRRRLFEEISLLRAAVPLEIEMHAHNDLGMAVANSVSAVRAGARYIDCTVGGMGERAGNCDMAKFVEAMYGYFGGCSEEYVLKVKECCNRIMELLNRRYILP